LGDKKKEEAQNNNFGGGFDFDFGTKPAPSNPKPAAQPSSAAFDFDAIPTVRDNTTPSLLE
jgi:hypothetical protein